MLVELVDGTDVEAQVDSDQMSPGNTIFWARLAKPISTVRAYAGTELVAEHELRACTDPVSCEVR